MRTPGVPIPSSFSSKKELKEELKQQGESRGWTSMNEFLDDDEEPIVHYGVKGMRWGVRNGASSSSSKASSGKASSAKGSTDKAPEKRSKVKTAAKVTGAVAVAVGAAFVAHQLGSSGGVKMSDVKVGNPDNLKAGKAYADTVLRSNFKKQVADLSKDIAQANAEQDAWMRSLGLGAIVNNRVGL